MVMSVRNKHRRGRHHEEHLLRELRADLLGEALLLGGDALHEGPPGHQLHDLGTRGGIPALLVPVHRFFEYRYTCT